MSVCSTLSSSHGAHPKAIVNLTVPELPSEECSLHLLFTLPPLIFIDKFEFPFKHRLWGHPDLELPVHALSNQDPTYVMIGLEGVAPTMTLEIPLHVRYARPLKRGGYQRARMDWPLFFSSCPRTSSYAVQQSLKLLTLRPPFVSPFNETAQTLTFFPSCPVANTSYEFIVPIGDTDHLALVQNGTAVVVVLCFFWVASALWHISRRPGPAKTSKTD